MSSASPFTPRSARVPLRLADLATRTEVALPSGRIAAVREANAGEMQLLRHAHDPATDVAESDALYLEVASRVLVDRDGTPLDAAVRDAEIASLAPVQLAGILMIARGRADAVLAAIAAKTGAPSSESPEGNGESTPAPTTPTSDPTSSS